MFEKVRKLFQNEDDKRLSEAESDFDALMAQVDQDELALERLERHILEEFDGIKKDVRRIRKEVDGLMMDEAA